MSNNLFPVFLKIETLNGLIVGGGKIAYEKLLFILKKMKALTGGFHLSRLNMKPTRIIRARLKQRLILPRQNDTHIWLESMRTLILPKSSCCRYLK